MFKIKIAGINILIRNKYKYSEYLCREYITEEEKTDFEVFASEKAISEEISNADIETDAAYAESVCLHREIAERLAEYDAFLLHSALIECDGRGVAFAARSGVGKSTHIALWQKNFGKNVRIVNGDKPIVRFVNGKIYAYGTPWLGKEGYGENAFCEFKSLCFIERGEINRIEPIAADIAAMMMFSQIYLPTGAENASKTLELADRFASRINFFRLSCNMEDEAAKIAYEGMQ